MPTVIVSRPADGQAGVFRKLKVLAGGRVVARVRPGQQQQIELPTGRNELIGKMDWFTSPPLPVDLNEGDVVHVEVSVGFPGGFAGFLAPNRGVRIRLIPAG